MTATERDTLVAYLEGVPTVNPQRGLSVCRICGKPNGAAERTDGVYLWPTGFTHYVKDHGVRPPQDFIAHVFAAQGRPAARPATRPTPGAARPAIPRSKASPARTSQVERLPRASQETLLRDMLSRWESSGYTDQKAAQVLMKHTGLNVWDRYHGANPVDPGFYAGELEREVEASLEADHLGLTAAQEAIVQRTITRAREALHAGEDYEDNVAGDRAVYLADDLTDAGVYTEEPVAVLVYARRRLRAALQSFREDAAARELVRSRGMHPRLAHHVVFDQTRRGVPADPYLPGDYLSPTFRETTFPFLSLEEVTPWIPMIEGHYPYGKPGRPMWFLEHFLAVDGNEHLVPARGTNLPVPQRHQTKEARLGFLRTTLKEAVSQDNGRLWGRDGKPTKLHLSMIAHAYSPDPKRLKREAGKLLRPKPSWTVPPPPEHEALTAAEYGLLGADLLAPDPVPGFPGPVTAAVLGHHVLERLPTRTAPGKGPPDAPPGGG